MSKENSKQPPQLGEKRNSESKPSSSHKTDDLWDDELLAWRFVRAWINKKGFYLIPKNKDHP
jgi:hypothetical protein